MKATLLFPTILLASTGAIASYWCEPVNLHVNSTTLPTISQNAPHNLAISPWHSKGNTHSTWVCALGPDANAVIHYTSTDLPGLQCNIKITSICDSITGQCTYKFDNSATLNEYVDGRHCSAFVSHMEKLEKV